MCLQKGGWLGPGQFDREDDGRFFGANGAVGGKGGVPPLRKYLVAIARAAEETGRGVAVAEPRGVMEMVMGLIEMARTIMKMLQDCMIVVMHKELGICFLVL